MAKVQGLTIKIGGDTSGLENALKKANTSVKSLSSELKNVNKLLKLDPKNTEMLKQKQDLLKQSIADTTNKLNALREAQSRYIQQGGNLNTKEYRQLEREIAQCEISLKKLYGEASLFTSIGSRLSSVGSTFQKLGSIVENVGQKLSVLSGAVAGVLTYGTKLSIENEKTTKQFEVFTGSVELAKDSVQKLREDSKKGVFNFQSLAKANTYLLGTGVGAEESRKAINDLANVMSLVGDSDAFDRMAYNLAQVKSNGKAMAIDLRQFANAGIPIWDLLTQSTGKSVEELKNASVSYEDLTKAFEMAGQEGGRFYQAQEQAMKTTQGKFTLLKGQVQDGLIQLTTSLLPTINEWLEKIRQKIEAFNNLPQDTKELVLKIALIVATLGPALIIIGKITSTIGSLFTTLGTISSFIGSYVIPAFKGIGLAISGISAPILAVIGIIVGIIAVFTTLWNTSERFRQVISDIGNTFKETFTNYVQPAISQIGETISNLFNTIIKPLWSFIVSVLEPGFTFFISVISGAINTLVRFFSGMIDSIFSALNGLINFIGGVFTGNWQKAWEGVKQIFKAVWDGLLNFLKLPLNRSNNFDKWFYRQSKCYTYTRLGNFWKIQRC